MSEEKPAPMLSLEDIWRIMVNEGEGNNARAGKLMAKVRDFYEAKIASGELIVVKTAVVELVPNNYDCMLTCTGCRDGVPYYLLEEFDEMNFCPSCGAKVMK